MNKLIKPGQIGAFSLGGLGEIGKNCYGIEYNNYIYIIDCGVLFPDDTLLGIDYVIPDFTYLIRNQERIQGLFITHGHEDHIGAIPYLLDKVKIPAIYGSRMAIDLIKDKLDSKTLKEQKIYECDSNTLLKFDNNNIQISFIRINHSIPDAYGINLKTPLGNVFQTGDFKIDMTPVGPVTDLAGLARIGNEGTILLLSDSTNAERRDPILSERIIGQSISDLFTTIDGRIIIATFASNVYRLQQIIDASIKTNRKIAIFGRSMTKIFEISIKNGFLKIPADIIITEDKINTIKPENLTIICTGSQGERLAVLNRIANGSHRYIKALPNDTVIFSSSPIPGNFLSVNETINQLSKIGIRVITNSPLVDTHSSGHASEEGLQLMLNLVKPKYFMPIHGEYRMQVAHTKLAQMTGVDINNCFVMDIGDMLVVEKDSAMLAGKIPSGAIYIDGSEHNSSTSALIKERKALSKDGIFLVVVNIDIKTSKTLTTPMIVSRGFIYVKDNEDLINNIADDISMLVNNYKSTDEEQLKLDIIELVNTKLFNITQRNPIPIVVIRKF